MSALDRKLTRDLWRLKGQTATIALVLACGVMAMVMLRSTWTSLRDARDAYYERARFADVFAQVERAPDSVAPRLANLPGVAVVETRIVKDVMVPLPGELDPVAGRVVSLPDHGAPLLNDVVVLAGRLPESDDELLLNEQFATAHGLEPGAHLPVVLEGRERSLSIVGVGLSPEYAIALSGRTLIADNGRFAVLWMRRAAIADAFRMEGAFDDAVIRVEPGASIPAVQDAVDRELARYGGRHAIARDRQLSHAMLASELDMLQTIAVVIPSMFLAVAAFLVNVIVSRLVFLERTQIAVLKALGFSNRRIAAQYLTLVGLIVAIGSLVGIGLGVWTGRWMTDIYQTFYRFPTKLFHVEPAVIVSTVGIGLAAAVTGALGAVFRVARMPPAQAMRPPAPLGYRRSLLERLGIGRVMGTSGMMVVREIERRPLRFAMSVLGIAMGVAIFVMGRFSHDSFDNLMAEVYPREHQEDLTVMFAHARPDRAARELAHIPGVELVDPVRVVPVRFHAGPRWRDSTITGLPSNSALRHLLDHGTTPLELPARGVVITDQLAILLGVHVGDDLEIELLDGDYRSRVVPIAGLIDEAFGMQGYARADWLAAIMREPPSANVALLRVDPAHDTEVRTQLKELPEVIGVTSTSRIIELYREQTAHVMFGMTVILTLSAAAIAIGIVYNNARIALSMRGRDLASLRVLGFTRREISTVLLGELGAEVALGIPLGLWLGTLLARFLAGRLDPETIRFPFHISEVTYAGATVIALASGVASALLVRRQLDRLDLVGVLKSSE